MKGAVYVGGSAFLLVGGANVAGALGALAGTTVVAHEAVISTAASTIIAGGCGGLGGIIGASSMNEIKGAVYVGGAAFLLVGGLHVAGALAGLTVVAHEAVNLTAALTIVAGVCGGFGGMIGVESSINENLESANTHNPDGQAESVIVQAVPVQEVLVQAVPVQEASVQP